MTVEKGIYMLDDTTDEFRFNQLMNDKQYFPKMMELEKYVSDEKDIIRYTANTSMSIRLDNNIKIPPKSIKLSYSSSNEMSCISISANFFDTFRINGDFNMDEVKNSFEVYSLSDKYIPTILGSSFIKSFNKNEVFYDAQGKAYIVLGFLEPDSFYIAPNRFDKLVYLNDYFIIPCQITFDDSVRYTFNFFSSYYIAASDTPVFNIIEKSKDLDLYSMRIRSFQQQLKYIKADTLEKVVFNSTMCIIILFMSIVGLMGNLIQFISDYITEFAIHLLCGANERDIIFRVSMQIFVLIILANTINFLIFHIGIATLITLGISLLMGILLLIYPIVKIYSQSIIIMIRRNVI